MTDFENGYREGVKFATDFLRAVAIAAASESSPEEVAPFLAEALKSVAKAIDHSAERLRLSQPIDRRRGGRSYPTLGKYPPAKPGALGLEPLEAAEGVADAAP